MTADLSAGPRYLPDPLDRRGRTGRPSFGERRPVALTVLTMGCLVVLALSLSFAVGQVMVQAVRVVLDLVSSLSLS
ncbi:hypothetical protein [Nocardioides panaciterrulae]|uniref:Uncharacterized protein n=1 Tax=Nocardioides panaciterrulae TaxID=661492 RepID=A0A7Y9E5G9_9ACTN|nr:hypothetical protein [Nocardioides panaciterrulae]NYD41191.1 hypothetical protein [Nocardioides panaciterrulae]